MIRRKYAVGDRFTYLEPKGEHEGVILALVNHGGLDLLVLGWDNDSVSVLAVSKLLPVEPRPAEVSA